MTQEIKEENNNNGWIKVSDRLPEEGGKYFVSSKQKSYWGNGKKVGVYYFFDTPADRENMLYHFTHWQPIILPEPPIE